MPRIRTPIDIGSVVRTSRQEKNLTLEELAERAHVSRRWLIQFEQGHPGAELSLVLRVFEALDITLDASTDLDAPASKTATRRRPPNLDLDRHLAGFADD